MCAVECVETKLPGIDAPAATVDLAICFFQKKGLHFGFLPSLKNGLWAPETAPGISVLWGIWLFKAFTRPADGQGPWNRPSLPPPAWRAAGPESIKTILIYVVLGAFAPPKL